MRFQSEPPQRRKRAVHRSLRLRLWLLFALLLGVMFAMRHLQEPRAVDRLGRVLLLDHREAVLQPGRPVEASPVATPGGAGSPSPSPQPLPPNARLVPREPLADVVDHTFLRSDEAPAWQATWRAVQQASPQQLAASTLGVIPSAALLEQPAEYRGRVITVRGVVLREEQLDASPEVEGLASYHRLVIAPEGGARRPVVLYVLRLPEAFPRGDGLRELVRAEAVFFKSWSYRAGDGQLELAPLAVAPEINWSATPEAGRPPRSAPSWTLLVLGGLGCVFVAAAVTWYVHLATRRRAAGKRVGDDHSTRQDLARLKEIEE